MGRTKDMLEQEAVKLEGLPGEAVAMDADGFGDWVAVCKTKKGLVVASPMGSFAAPPDLRFPIVRLFPPNRIIVVNSRIRRVQDNAFVLNLDGSLEARCCVGDGVADVLPTSEEFAVTYFDEGVFGDVPPAQEGLCLFSAKGDLRFRYQSEMKSPVDIADCYCACSAGPFELCFSPYTGFPLVRLNLKRMEQTVVPLPEILHGAAALATNGTDFFFYSPYSARGGMFQWRVGCEYPQRIGTYDGPLWGRFPASFLAPGSSGYTIVRPTHS